MDRAEIIRKIASEIEALASKPLADHDEEIFKSGFLDSLNVMHIIVFIEQEFLIKIDAFELTIDTLGTANRIADYVSSKLASR